MKNILTLLAIAFAAQWAQAQPQQLAFECYGGDAAKDVVRYVATRQHPNIVTVQVLKERNLEKVFSDTGSTSSSQDSNLQFIGKAFRLTLIEEFADGYFETNLEALMETPILKKGEIARIFCKWHN